MRILLYKRRYFVFFLLSIYSLAFKAACQIWFRSPRSIFEDNDFIKSDV